MFCVFFWVGDREWGFEQGGKGWVFWRFHGRKKNNTYSLLPFFFSPPLSILYAKYHPSHQPWHDTITTIMVMTMNNHRIYTFTHTMSQFMTSIILHPYFFPFLLLSLWWYMWPCCMLLSPLTLVPFTIWQAVHILRLEVVGYRDQSVGGWDIQLTLA